MPPEQSLLPNSVDHRADIYALGATFYHTVTETLPFPARSAREAMLKHVTEELVPPHEIVPELPEELSDVILAMMAKDPEDRYQTAEDLLADLDELAQVLKPTAVSVSSSSVESAVGFDTTPIRSRPTLSPLETQVRADTTPVTTHDVVRRPDYESDLREGVKAGQAGQLERACELLTRVAEHNPLNDRAWMWLAYFSPSPDQAIGYLNQLLEYQPDHEAAQKELDRHHLELGMIEASQGRTQEARQHLLPLVERDQENAQVWLWLARVAESTDEAIDCYCQVLAIEPDHAEARAELNYLER